MERAESLDQMFHLDDILVPDLGSVNMVDTRGIEDVGIASQDFLGGANATHTALVQKGYALAPSHLIEIGCRSHNGDAPLLKHPQHIPQLLAGHGIHTSCGLVKQQDAGLVHQGAR